ncbi:MAG TPA: hypothetical protein VFQ80_03045 [Thermomicrobiales bacterium]|jgi:hypothetical protein|nr:hypothetical protein [Thermomicrobiales bacterium]
MGRQNRVDRRDPLRLAAGVRRFAALAAAILCLTALAQAAGVDGWRPAAAQELTPIPAADVDRARCVVAPRPDADFVAIDRGTPFAKIKALGTPVPTPLPPTDGRPADPATVAAVTATFTEEIACLYAGDVRRFAALLTDAQFQRAFGGIGGSTIGGAHATPTPLPLEARAANLAIGDVRIHPDGRVSAMTTSNGKRSLTIFAKVGERYLIDNTMSLSPAATPAP